MHHAPTPHPLGATSSRSCVPGGSERFFQGFHLLYTQYLPPGPVQRAKLWHQDTSQHLLWVSVRSNRQPAHEDIALDVQLAACPSRARCAVPIITEKPFALVFDLHSSYYPSNSNGPSLPPSMSAAEFLFGKGVIGVRSERQRSPVGSMNCVVSTTDRDSGLTSVN
ncbi:unnamed protein product [Cyclocybe aegerita]|uniref:Uncharacterized protein n=1 Tax=Cyclocybe aegerita TaxID=1973307 RepID=A0A8S0X0I7_CYCAE|nr:unnamed protein product [Cyclocybe aegerita]